MTKTRGAGRRRRHCQSWIALPIAFLAAACPGCSTHDQPGRLAAAKISFQAAIRKGQVVRQEVSLGHQVRLALAPRQTEFISDPISVSGQALLWTAVGLKGRAPKACAKVTFEVTAVGQRETRRLLHLTGAVDFQPGRWRPVTVRLPPSLGFPMTLHFLLSGSGGPKAALSRSCAIWALPRLLKREPQSLLRRLRATIKTAPGPSQLPSVILIVLDTLRADHTGPWGYRRGTTPFLDDLGAKGVTVTDAISAYPTTLASHWSLFTGATPRRHGVYEPGLAPARQLAVLADILRQKGYLTAAFTEGGFVHSTLGFSRGFDLYDNGASKKVRDFRGHAEETFSKAARWIAHNARSRSFIFIHTYQVHTPYTPPLRCLRLLEKGYSGRFAKSLGALYAFSINSGRLKLTPTEVEHIRTLYDAEIRCLDGILRRFWHTLNRARALRNTVVIVTADHGEDLLEHGWLTHGTTLYDVALRVPLMIIWPGTLPAGARLSCQRSLTDLMPTLLDLLGFSSPPGIDGRTFAAELRRGGCSSTHPAFSELRKSAYRPPPDLPEMAVRLDGWKLIQHTKSGREELYRLRDDSSEMVNLATSEVGVLKQMRQELHLYLKKTTLEPVVIAQPGKALTERLHELGYIW